jgi:hypothetical protein
MSMPLLDSILVTSKERPTEWVLRTSKGRIIFGKFQNGKLTLRYDSKYAGPFLFDKEIKNKKLQSSMSTLEMLRIANFRLEHDEVAEQKRPG